MSVKNDIQIKIQNSGLEQFSPKPSTIRFLFVEDESVALNDFRTATIENCGFSDTKSEMAVIKNSLGEALPLFVGDAIEFGRQMSSVGDLQILAKGTCVKIAYYI